MSKGLDKLKTIRHIYHSEYGEDISMDKDLDIIEKELKEYEIHKEILNDYGLTLVDFREACLLLAMLKGNGRNIHNIDKQLKTLEIIKRINFDIVYREQFDEWTLFIVIETQDGEDLEPVAFGSGKEEYDLLTEVLL